MNSIIQTKISVFRNLKDYKFMPKLEQEKYAEIEQKVDDALSNLTNWNNSLSFLK